MRAGCYRLVEEFYETKKYVWILSSKAVYLNDDKDI